MKNLKPLFALVFLALTISSCSAVTGIFKAGMGFGIFIVVLILVIIGFLVFRSNKK